MSPRRSDRLGPVGALSAAGGLLVVAAVMGVLAALLVVPFVAAGGMAARTVADGAQQLPEALNPAALAQRTTILAKNGAPLATIYDQNRVSVPLAKVAPIMREAIISIEDYRFYQHGALDAKGTLRAFVTNQAGDGVSQGGSSITQQMVKMTLLNQAKTPAARQAATAETYQRKLNELRYAIAFEEKYSKNWILERYLNIAYFGDGAYGIEAAAEHYFNTTAADLKLRQAALLAGLVQNPAGYNPATSPSRAKDRRDVVLERMGQLNVITPQQALLNERRGLGLDIQVVPNGCVSSKAPFFCDYAIQYLLADKALGATEQDRRNLLWRGGLTIKTTIDMRFQRAADRSVRGHVYATDRAIGGLAMIRPGSGEVRALAQSRPMGSNSKQGQTYLNYVVPSAYGDSNGFQAGSTFKAFVLSAALEQGIRTDTSIVSPQEKTLPVSSFRGCNGPLKSTDVWQPQNSTGAGTFDLYTGTQLSVNTFYAQLEQRTGLCEPAKLAREMGVQVPSPVYPAFTLGVSDTNPLSMAEAYATFAARGEHCDARPVTSVVDMNGKTVEDFPATCSQVLSQRVADQVNDILRGVQEGAGFGASAGLALNQQSAGKTGTTDRNRAVWFVGYTPNMAAAAMLAGANRAGHWRTLNGQYVGGTYIDGAHGSTNAGPIWGDAMKQVENLLPDARFHKPAPEPAIQTGTPGVVPSVYGLSPQAAAGVISRAGFTAVTGPSVNSSNGYGTVAYLSPGSGSQAAPGTPVTIYTSNGTP